MTDGLVPTQGTKVYLADNATTSVPTVVKMDCPTGVQGVGGGAADQIETTCLDTIGDKEFAGGLGNPAPITVPFNFIPRSYSHQNLLELKRLKTVLKWFLVMADQPTDPGNEAYTEPNLDSDGEFVAPLDRSSIAWSGYVSEVNLDFATNEIVRGTLTIQRSGIERLTAYVPA